MYVSGGVRSRFEPIDQVDARRVDDDVRLKIAQRFDDKKARTKVEVGQIQRNNDVVRFDDRAADVRRDSPFDPRVVPIIRDRAPQRSHRADDDDFHSASFLYFPQTA